MVRLRRKPASLEVVGVTGAATGLGRLLVERLSLRTDLAGLLGIDAAPANVDGVVWRIADVRDPLLGARLEGVTVLVHLATTYDLSLLPTTRQALNVRGTAQVLAAAAESGVRRVVLCTSAEVYGARPDNPVPLPDSWPSRADAEVGSLVEDHLRMEELAEQARRQGMDVVVVRPAALVGLPGACDGPLLKLLGAPRLLAVKGVEPLWQLCHVDDLVLALELASLGELTGSVAVACEGAMPQDLVERMAGRGRLELPASVALSTAERLHRLRLSNASPRELDLLLGPLVVEADGALAAGWSPLWTNELALQAHLQGRAGDGRTAAYTAAGATVALLGTAALLRQARRRRRR